MDCPTIVDERRRHGIVEIDSISQTGCASRRSPMSPTIPGPCSVTGSPRGALTPRARTKDYPVIAAPPFAFYRTPVSYGTPGPRAGLECSVFEKKPRSSDRRGHAEGLY